MTDILKMDKLVWEFDGDGSWDAYSRVMDPCMTDEVKSIWCREWCLAWCIYVDEDGLFCVNNSDRLLLAEAHELRGPITGYLDRYVNLGELKAKIDLVEARLREMTELSDGSPVELLDMETYTNG